MMILFVFKKKDSSNNGSHDSGLGRVGVGVSAAAAGFTTPPRLCYMIVVCILWSEGSISNIEFQSGSIADV
jgi:hypothetical protein